VPKRFKASNHKGMTKEERLQLIDTSWELHHKVEVSYLQNMAKKGDEKWLEKQRLLLADMALHLLQTAVKPGELELDKLQDNLHAILTISDSFLPQSELKQATHKIYSSEEKSK